MTHIAVITGVTNLGIGLDFGSLTGLAEAAEDLR